MRSMAARVLAVLLPCLGAGSAPAAGQEAPADLIVAHGVIRTMRPGTSPVEALAARGGAIVGLGSSAEIEARFLGPDTRVLDVRGRTVLPGLIDAHAHVLGLGEALRELDLVGTTSPEQIAARVREAVAGRPAGAWIVGQGWDQNDWSEKAFPTHAVLDSAAPRNPLVLGRVDGHAVWASASALAAAGIDASTPDPPGGRILRDDTGNPTGILIDNATDLVERAIPAADSTEVRARLEAAQRAMLAVGLTGAHDMGVWPDTLEMYRRWADAGVLVPRFAVYLLARRAGALEWWEAGGGERVRAGDDSHLRVVGVKFYADGALGSRGAALLEPYADDPGNRGLLVMDPDTLKARVARTLALGLQPAIHAIGDRGNRIALDAIEFGLDSLRARLGPGARPDVTSYEFRPHRRPRIEHAQVVALEDIPRFARLGVVASMQPTHATSDMYWAEDRVGPRRIGGAYAWRRMRDAGVPLVCGSDFPVESPNPFFGIYAAVTRQDQKSWPPEGWRVDQAMTREQAVACFTRDAASVVGMQDAVGTLEVGKRADLVVLDRDPMRAPAADLWRTRVLQTVIDGEIVYEAPEAAASTR